MELGPGCAWLTAPTRVAPFPWVVFGLERAQAERAAPALKQSEAECLGIQRSHVGELVAAQHEPLRHLS